MKAVACFCSEDAKFSGLPAGLLFTDIWYTLASAALLDWCGASLLSHQTHKEIQYWGLMLLSQRCSSVWKLAKEGNIQGPGKVACYSSTKLYAKWQLWNLHKHLDPSFSIMSGLSTRWETISSVSIKYPRRNWFLSEFLKKWQSLKFGTRKNVISWRKKHMPLIQRPNTTWPDMLPCSVLAVWCYIKLIPLV